MTSRVTGFLIVVAFAGAASAFAHEMEQQPATVEADATIEQGDTIPAGTVIEVRTTQPLSSKRNRSGQTFRAIIEEDVLVGDQRVIPRGSQAVGRLMEVSAAGKTAGAKMSLVLTSVTVGRRRIQIETEALAMEAKSDTGRDAGRIIGGTAIGAIIGGIAGGGDGAGIGAIVGGGAGTAAAVLTKGRELEFEAEQEFHFTLAVPVNVRR